jgi:uracil-DNA glycosylase family 4
VVVYRGPPCPRLLFVGEAPGKEEDARGEPFVGRSGRILEEALARSPWPRDQVGITNAVMCRPPGNRLPAWAVDACHDWLEGKIRALDPPFLVTLGGTALGALIPRAPRPLEAAGRWFSWEGRPLFALLHPAATLRSGRFSQRWRRDWDRLRRDLPSLYPAGRSPGSPAPPEDRPGEKPYNRRSD